ncbi:MAG: methyltransferase domain-containing protein [Desulfobacterales bacterium]|jgi:SAM-dependent methyltransferase/FKBP-type peptidyl-prolyl cis-trans isomerase 2
MIENFITMESLVDVVFHLKWKSDTALHTDGYQASRINIWRDYLPPFIVENLMGKQAGERIDFKVDAEDVIPDFSGKKIFQVDKKKIDGRPTAGETGKPKVGRFYPKGILKDVDGVFSANVQPFRCVGLNNGQVSVDFNHPLTGKALTISALIGKVETNDIERGGSSADWMETLTNGPGMQARWQGRQTDFFSGGGFRREDETPDSRFYSAPRFVQHIDDTAIDIISNTYGRFLKDGMNVLDLMSSWQSHLPENLRLGRVAGIGLNASELNKNNRLSEVVVQDLNVNTGLPFESNSFDAVVCTVSIEYLVEPLAIFKEVSRILRADGHFIVTFSNRCFPTKAIQVWKELHEFERMGMVLEYFSRSGDFKDLQTYSFRGLPRLRNDKYFPELRYADPVYAVWGQKR